MSMKFGFVAACVFASLLAPPALAADEPGVTATEIKIGGIFPFSGPASSIGLVGKGVMAYVQSINDRGGINGRKINYVAMDDAYFGPAPATPVIGGVPSEAPAPAAQPKTQPTPKPVK